MVSLIKKFSKIAKRGDSSVASKYASSSPSVGLLFHLNGSREWCNVVTNIAMAAMAITHMENGLFREDHVIQIPQFPDKVSDALEILIREDEHSTAEEQEMYIKDIYDNPTRGGVRLMTPLQLAAMITPVMLLWPSLLHMKRWSREDILRVRMIYTYKSEWR
jgi:hypothetical protein